MDAEGHKPHPQSGLDYLRELLKDWHGSAMAETMNMRLIAVDDGTATFEGIPSPKFYNPQMRVHGGHKLQQVGDGERVGGVAHGAAAKRRQRRRKQLRDVTRDGGRVRVAPAYTEGGVAGSRVRG